MKQLLLYIAAGILSLLYYAAVLQLFRIARVLEQIRDQDKPSGLKPGSPGSPRKFDIKGGVK